MISQSESATLQATATVSSALRHSNFRWYLAGMSAFGLAQTMNRFLLPWLAYEGTGSSAVLGFVGFALAAPTLLLSPIGGVYADRVHRLRLIRRTQLMWAFVFVLFAAVFASGNGGIEMIFVVAVVSGGLLAFEQPARQALVPSLVSSAGLSSAYGWINASWNVSGMIGPSLAAVILAATLPFGMGAAPLLALTAAGSLLMVLMTTRVKDVLPRPARSGLRWWQDIAAGLRFLAVSPVPGSLVLLAFTINALGFSAVFLMPAFARERSLTPTLVALDCWCRPGVPAH